MSELNVKAPKHIPHIEMPVEDVASKKLPIGLRIFGLLSALAGIAELAVFGLSIAYLVYCFTNGINLASQLEVSNQALVLYILYIVANFALTIQFIVFGLRLQFNKRKYAAQQTIAMIAVQALIFALTLMILGVGPMLVYEAVIFIFLLVMHVYLDPSLVEERRLQRQLQEMEDRDAAKAGTLGLDTTGKGYITLNFFNVFWIFVVACIVGLIIESAVCPFLNGRIDNRTGVLWGPFSPIYGVGAVLMTAALNRFYKKNPILIFCVSALIGAGFEFLVSWFFQFAFGILAWDYSGEFLNIAGRTDFAHALCWGTLGIFWIKVCLPRMLKLINKIPWNWRYAVTTIFAVFMVFDITMTMLAFDCWFQRASGVQPDTPVAQFFDQYYGDDYMKGHFQTMSIHPDLATHR